MKKAAGYDVFVDLGRESVDYKIIRLERLVDSNHRSDQERSLAEVRHGRETADSGFFKDSFDLIGMTTCFCARTKTRSEAQNFVAELYHRYAGYIADKAREQLDLSYRIKAKKVR